MNELLAIRIIRCLESPKSLGELTRCATPPYEREMDVYADLTLLKILGIVREVSGKYSLTEKGKLIIRRLGDAHGA